MNQGITACPVAEIARSDGRAIAISGDNEISYSDLDLLIGRIGDQMTVSGLRRGDVVAAYLPNGLELIALLFASFRTGVVLFPLNLRIPPSGLAAQISRSPARKIIVRDGAGIAAEFRSAFHGFEIIEFSKLLSTKTCGPASHSLALRMIDMESPALLLGTSGSTGIPKLAVLSFGNLYFNALGSNENIVVNSGDRWLLSLPLYHVGALGILFRCFLAGATVVLPPAKNEMKSLSIELLSQMNITHLSLVLTQWVRLLRDLDTKKLTSVHSSLKAVLLGGSAVSEKLLRRSLDQDWPVYTSYGLTEMASQVTTGRIIGSEVGLSGKCLPYREIKISDSGEICVRGKTLFLGYHSRSQNSLELDLDDSGWFETKDLGRMEADGLRVTGRRDHLFISGGENVHPEEIEMHLCSIPEVEQAIVVPVTDPEFGFRPVVFVQSGSGFDFKKAQEKLLETLPKYKVPCACYPWPDELAPGLKPNRKYFLNLAETFAR